jgi:hypothetical protein
MAKLSVSEQILKIQNAIVPCDGTCRTCTRPVYAPFRRHDASGKIIHGCIDASHEAYMSPSMSTGAWHFSANGIALRKATLAHLKSL